MANIFVEPPSHFVPTDNPAQAWEEWKTSYQLYEAACQYSDKPDNVRRALLLHSLGPTARNIYKTYAPQPATEETDSAKKDTTEESVSTKKGATERSVPDSVKYILGKFDELYLPYKNVTHATAVFNMMAQREGQSVDEYVTELQLQAQRCDFGDKTSRLIGDRIILGIRDPALRERLLRESDLSLEKVVQFCKAAAISKKHMRDIDNMGPEVSVSALHEQQWQQGRSAQHQGRAHGGERQLVKHDRFRPLSQIPGLQSQPYQLLENRPPLQPSSRQYSASCSRCGLRHRPQHCPAYGMHCLSCGKFGHFARMCRQRMLPGARRIDMLDTATPDGITTDNETLLGELIIDTLSRSSSSQWLQSVQIQDRTIEFKLDTGADVNVLPYTVIESCSRKPVIEATEIKVQTFSGEPLPIVGKCQLNCVINGKNCRLEFVVVRMNVSAILGKRACEELNLVKRVRQVQRTTSSNEEFQSILAEFPDVFEGIGCLPGTYSISLKEGVTPSVSAPRKIPLALEASVKRELESMESNGVITKVTESTDWVHPIVVVPKKNGTVRVCLDPRKLNVAIKREYYKIPTEEEMLANLSKCKLFTLFDANHAFWHTPLDTQSSYLCTFATPWGRYRFLRLPFGLSSAPEIFQRAMDDVFRGHNDIRPYFDDILLAAKTTDQHKEQLRRVLTLARNNNLKLNPSKTQLAQPRVKYFGHVLTDQGICADEDKVRAISAMKLPANKAELQRFLGMVTYLAKCLPHLSQETSELRELLKSDVPWLWDANKTKQFDHIRELLKKAPVLAYFDKTKPVTLSTDASSYGIGTVLMQDGRPVAYASAALNETQQSYAQIEKELLAVVFACTHFHYYIFGRSVEVHTDHKPLIGLKEKPYDKVSSRLQRLLLRLNDYNVTLTYVPGKYLTIADALSRAPDPAGMIDDNDGAYPITVCTLATASTPKFLEIRAATVQDETLQAVIFHLNNGWPQHRFLVRPDRGWTLLRYKRRTVRYRWVFMQRSASCSSIIVSE
ncbi:uncharacterized protein LOC135380477 [Ornithodoros turicata]|uniref:uncharacterized protein LOC135380477 n=1 Tax=Ornithodoros turicata TaxID=34597 RepID=UPI00313891EB